MNNHQAEATQAEIMVVDDTPTNLQLLSSILIEQGYQVRSMIDGLLALESALCDPPDLILLDIIMPKIDGYEVCKQLKSNQKTQGVPVIFISALDETWDKVKAFAVGGADYITKPFQVEEVLARVENQLTLHKLQTQLIEQNQLLQQEIRDRISAQAALEALNQELETRIQARTVELRDYLEQLRNLESQLRQSLEREKEVSDLKSRIIFTISHEYRTPLMTILSSVELLEKYRHKFTDSQQLKHFWRIQAAVKHMTTLVNDLLFINQAEFDKLELKPVALNLVTFCQELFCPIKSSLGAKHRLIFSSERDWEPILGDPKILRQILTNIISNAIKYSPDGGTILVQLNGDEEKVILQIIDQGIGIPKEDQPKLFESFSRASNVGIIPGTGLGLSIVKSCVDSHGGKIHVESEVGVGTTFTITLPKNLPEEE
ncbi:MAG: hybrid sensor histidine kinase/response regulator [Moorea sp. SIO3I7]|uniref:hybrid sensor histidine kinase/response regulator n=2 Tax=unclassified Moorena TaxID=2683338 RepID=UPI0013BECE29|nr:hybrid sensor histidine kinase/response regulator [Moorena sp. SIO3I8]NEN95100.1 hybrid sensor histidine kinase/response regulator [Moorena sp. SIO3I7]NEO05462.1 hybrid sensor histidine kinase/response regulator [Moorena sp. SIO3I8]